MKLIVNAFLALVLTFSVTAAAKAEMTGTPLMVIRYNQKTVSYQEKLAFAVNEAVKTKPGVVFEVVDVAPEGEIGRLHGQEIVDAIGRRGIKPEQITLRNESGAVENEEIRIFVR